jgi:hypothetical protein
LARRSRRLWCCRLVVGCWKSNRCVRLVGMEDNRLSRSLVGMGMGRGSQLLGTGMRVSKLIPVSHYEFSYQGCGLLDSGCDMANWAVGNSWCTRCDGVLHCLINSRDAVCLGGLGAGVHLGWVVWGWGWVWLAGVLIACAGVGVDDCGVSGWAAKES